VIDQGGYLKGFPHEEISEKMVSIASQENDKKTDLIYYNNENEIMVLLDGGERKPYRSINFKENREKRGAFWDLSHTTGSDLKLGPTETAVMTTSIHTISRDLYQAAWRLRGLATGQKIRFALKLEEKEAMQKALKEDLKYEVIEEFDTTDLFLFLKLNEAKRQAQMNLRAFKQKIEGVYVREVIQEYIKENSWRELVGFFERTKDLFLNDDNSKPFEKYGKPKILSDKDTVMRGEKKALMAKEPIKAFLERKEELQTDLNQEVDNILEKFKGLLAAQIESPMTDDENGKEMEVEEEQEQEEEEEIEEERSLQNSGGEVNQKQRKHLSWYTESLGTNLCKNEFTEEELKTERVVEDRVESGDYCPMIKLKTAFSLLDEPQLEQLFSNLDELYVSLNVLPLFKENNEEDDFKAYSPGHLGDRSVLLIGSNEDKGNPLSYKLEKAVILNKHDALDLEAYIQDNVDKEGLYLLLHDYNIGNREKTKAYKDLLKGAEDPFSLPFKEEMGQPAAEKQRHILARMLGLTKMFNTYSFLRNEERDALMQWYKDKKVNVPQGMRNLFEEQMLEYRFSDKDAYMNSTMQTFIDELSLISQ
jgi:hypothetical protein